jgi:hypothetical protein
MPITAMIADIAQLVILQTLITETVSHTMKSVDVLKCTTKTHICARNAHTDNKLQMMD